MRGGSITSQCLVKLFSWRRLNKDEQQFVECVLSIGRELEAGLTQESGGFYYHAREFVSGLEQNLLDAHFLIDTQRQSIEHGDVSAQLCRDILEKFPSEQI